MADHKFALIQPQFSGHGQIIGLSQTYIQADHPYLCVELLGYRPTYRTDGMAVAYEVWLDGQWRERADCL